MTTIQSPVPVFTDSDGSPLDAGYIYIGAVNQNPETNPITVYWDVAQTQPVAQPIRTLNGRIVRDGTIANVYVSTSYSLTVKNKNGILILSFLNSDDFNPVGNISGSNGSSLVGFIQGGTGAVARTVQSKLRERISVTDFGAKGDGITDDTAAIQAAITYVRSLPNGELYFPPNLPSCYYKTTASLNVDGPIRIVGAGANSSTIIGVGLAAGTFILDFNCLAANVVEQATVENLTLRTLDKVPNGLRLKNVSYVNMKNVQIYNVANGMYFEGTRTFSNVFDNVTCYSITNNSVRFNNNFSGGGQWTFTGCTFTGDTGFVVDNTSATDGVTLVGCNFEQCATNSLYIGGTVRGLSLFGCRTEGNNGTIDFQINPVAGKRVEGLAISGCCFTTDAGASIPISLGGSGGTVRGFSICGNQVEYAGSGTCFVKLNGEGESGVVAGNRFTQNNTTPTDVQRNGVVVFGNENAGGKCAEYWGAAQWGVVEGTFTPNDASGAGLAFAIATGNYTKIGRMVFWRAFVRYPTTANANVAAIGGFPYAMSVAGGGSYDRAGASVTTTNAGIAIGIRQTLPNNTSVALYDPLNNGTTRTNAQLSGKDLEMSGFYNI